MVEEICRELARLYLGDRTRRQEPLKPKEIAIRLGISKRSFYYYREESIRLGFIELDSTGKAIQPKISEESTFKEFNKDNQFIKDPLIIAWISDLQVRRNGLPRAAWPSFVSALELLCNTVKVKPIQLVQTTENLENIIKNYAEHLRNVRKLDEKQIQQALYHVKMPARDFASLNGLHIRRGITGV